jgi:hypothetical protein
MGLHLNNWMKAIKDEVLLKDVVIAGSHNSATYGMIGLARCQDGTHAEQFALGVRYFDLRTKVVRGKSYVSHNVKGLPFDVIVKDLKNVLDNIGDEFIILDLREYRLRDCRPQMPEVMQKMRAAKPHDIDDLFEKYLLPEKHALTDFDIATLSMNEVRKSGKKYILLNAHKSYKFSCDTVFDFPWGMFLHGKTIEDFIAKKTQCVLDIEPEGFFGLQTQLTPNPITKIGLRNPETMERMFKPYFANWMRALAANPQALKKLNIIANNSMTAGTYKQAEILRMNLLKNNIKEEFVEEFEAMVNAYGLH